MRLQGVVCSAFMGFKRKKRFQFDNRSVGCPLSDLVRQRTTTSQQCEAFVIPGTRMTQWMLYGMMHVICHYAYRISCPIVKIVFRIPWCMSYVIVHVVRHIIVDVICHRARHTPLCILSVICHRCRTSHNS